MPDKHIQNDVVKQHSSAKLSGGVQQKVSPSVIVCVFFVAGTQTQDIDQHQDVLVVNDVVRRGLLIYAQTKVSCFARGVDAGAAGQGSRQGCIL